MSLILQPSLTTSVGKSNQTDYNVAFSYNFHGDVLSTQTVAGGAYIGQGSSFTLNFSSLFGNVSVLPAFRSLLLQTRWYQYLGLEGAFDGSLFISTPGIGLLAMLSQPPVEIPAGTIDQNTVVPTSSVCLPLVLPANATVTFTKFISEHAGGANTPPIGGVISGVFTTNQIPPFTTAGVTQAFAI